MMDRDGCKYAKTCFDCPLPDCRKPAPTREYKDKPPRKRKTKEEIQARIKNYSLKHYQENRERYIQYNKDYRRNVLKIVSREDKHNKRLELFRQGLTDEEIAKQVNCTARTIRDWRRKNKLERG